MSEQKEFKITVDAIKNIISYFSKLPVEQVAHLITIQNGGMSLNGVSKLEDNKNGDIKQQDKQ